MLTGGGQVRFGPFQFDLTPGELHKHGVRLRLQNQPAKILAYLLEHRERIVTREELEKVLWSDGTFVDFDGGLNAAMNRLRRVLSDSADSPRYIETIARRGYRFIAEIEPVTRPEVPVPVVSQSDPPVVNAFPLGYRVWIVALLLVSLAAAGAWRSYHKNRSVPSLRRIIQVTSEPGSETSPSFSPDGTEIAFSADFAQLGNFDIYVKNIASGDVLRLTSDGARDSRPAWSPDGKSIAFIRNEGYGGAIYVMPATGGPEIRLAGVNLGALAWTADSKYLAALHRASQVDMPHQLLIDIATHRTRPLSSLREREDYAAAFSPDGMRVALARCKAGHCEVHAGMIAPDRTVVEPTRKLATARGFVEGLAWSDQKTILFSAGSYNDWGLWRVSADTAAVAEVLDVGHRSVHYPVIALRGPAGFTRIAFETRTQDENVWTATLPLKTDGTASRPRLLIASNRGDWWPDPSPDGRSLAFVSDRSGWQQIWISATDGSGARPLTDLPSGYTWFPRWAPDGTEIVFSHLPLSEKHGESAIFTIRPEYGSRPVRITPPGQRAKHGVFSPDGRWIYYAVRSPVRSQIWRSPRSGGIGQQLTQYGGEFPLLSHDRIYYVSTGDGVWSADLDGRNERKVLPEAHNTSWHPVRDGVLFVPRPENPLAGHLAHWSAVTGEIRSMGRLPHPDFLQFTVSSRGDAIFYSRQDRSDFDIAMVENFREHR